MTPEQISAERDAFVAAMHRAGWKSGPLASELRNGEWKFVNNLAQQRFHGWMLRARCTEYDLRDLVRKGTSAAEEPS